MFDVTKERCDECLFGENPIVSNSRRKEVIQGCLSNDSHFICHKTKDACCRGFYETQSTNMIRISQRMGCIREVEIQHGN